MNTGLAIWQQHVGLAKLNKAFKKPIGLVFIILMYNSLHNLSIFPWSEHKFLSGIMEELKIPYKILSEATIRMEKLVLKGQKHKGILYASLYIKWHDV